MERDKIIEQNWLVVSAPLKNKKGSSIGMLFHSQLEMFIKIYVPVTFPNQKSSLSVGFPTHPQRISSTGPPPVDVLLVDGHHHKPEQRQKTLVSMGIWGADTEDTLW